MHNQTRINAVNKGSYEQTISGLEILRRRGLKVRAIAVINKQSINYPEAIINAMYDLKMPFSANICSARPTDPEEVKNLAITDIEYANFLLKLFGLWIAKDNPNFRVKPLEDIAKTILGGRPSLCKYRGECQNYVSIDYNGDVYPCDEFLGEDYLLGNLLDKDFSELTKTKEFENYYKGRLEISKLCYDCEWYKMCYGGCMREWSGRKSILKPRQEEYCLARQMLFQGIKDKLAKL